MGSISVAFNPKNQQGMHSSAKRLSVNSRLVTIRDVIFLKEVNSYPYVILEELKLIIEV
jgi:hypothetical protein